MFERVGFWAFGDEDLGIQTPGFTFANVLAGRTQRRQIILDEWQQNVDVPAPGALALFKACALHNRDLAYRSFHDGVAGMHIGPERMPLIRAQSESYYLRKAGKDLFDLSLLMAIGAGPDLHQLAGQFGLADTIGKIIHPIADAVREEGTDIAKRSNHEPDFDKLADALQITK